MLAPYTCADCGLTHEPAVTRWRCDCGGLLQLVDLPAVWTPRHDAPSLWRYSASIAGADVLDWPAVSMGEGQTPLVAAEDGVLLKLEYASPTASFKDRGAVVLVALAKLLGASRVVADSSGNAGTAIAAYAARARIPAEVYVPAATSEKKLLQVRGHGATVVAVPGSREDTAAAAVERVGSLDAFYASHVYNPYFYEGTKTYAFEVLEQLGAAPATLVLPAGNGTLVLGSHLGFRLLRDAGVIDHLPRLVAVQASHCAPLAAAFDGRAPEPFEPTVAEGIAIAAPARARSIVDAVRDTGGTFVTVSEEEVAESHGVLARQGFWVEPTGAVSYAAARQLARQGRLGEGPVVAPLCGSGLKASL